MGPAGPQGEVGPGSQGETGPEGPRGPQGEVGPAAEGILIEKLLSASAYDEDGFITITDSRITPTSFRAVYLKFDYGNGTVGYLPLDYLLIDSVSLTLEEFELNTPIIIVAEGGMAIIDTREDLLDTALDAFQDNGAIVNLAILVAG